MSALNWVPSVGDRHIGLGHERRGEQDGQQWSLAYLCGCHAHATPHPPQRVRCLFARKPDPTPRLIPTVAAMTLACAVHWYESLLFLAPVVMTMGVIWVSSRIENRREMREEAEETRPAGFEPATSSSGGTRSIQLS